MVKKLQDGCFADRNRLRARQRYKRMRQTEKYKQQHRTAARFRRRTGDLKPELKLSLENKKYVGLNKRRQLTARQQYWLRRRRLLAVAQKRAQQQTMMQKMQSQSDVSTLDVQLFLTKPTDR